MPVEETVPKQTLTQFQQQNDQLAAEREKLFAALAERETHATLIHGCSNNWLPEHFEAQRLLNSSLHGVTVITFDQARERAERINTIRPTQEIAAAQLVTNMTPFQKNECGTLCNVKSRPAEIAGRHGELTD